MFHGNQCHGESVRSVSVIVKCCSLLQEPQIDYNKNPELRKLQFHGAGPKAALPKLEEGQEEGMFGSV